MDQAAIPLDPAWHWYVDMELSGCYHMMTVRDEGILVGYYGAIVKPHLHYKTSLTAWSDILYILPEYRKTGWGLAGTGYRLICEAEKMLKDLGVQKSYLMTKAYLPIKIIVKRLKYRLTEIIYTKLL